MGERKDGGGGDQSGVLGPLTPTARSSLAPGLASTRERGETPATRLLTFTFMRSSQKFRGGSTMVVLSSIT